MDIGFLQSLIALSSDAYGRGAFEPLKNHNECILDWKIALSLPNGMYSFCLILKIFTIFSLVSISI